MKFAAESSLLCKGRAFSDFHSMRLLFDHVSDSNYIERDVSTFSKNIIANM